MTIVASSLNSDDHVPREPASNHALPQLTNNSTASTTTPNSKTDETASPSSALSPVPDSPPRLIKSSSDGSHTQSTPTTLLEFDAEAGSIKTLAIKWPHTPAPMASDEAASGRSPKRSREEDKDDEVALPAPKRLSRNQETKTQASRQTSTAESDEAIPDRNSEDEAHRTVVSQKPNRESNVPHKRTVTRSSRLRACAECRRRKVKCKHSFEEITGYELNTPDSRSLSESTHERATGSKVTEAEDIDDRVISRAPASLRTAANVNNDDKTSEATTSKKANAKKRAASKIVRAPPERTSTRSRKAPERFEDFQEHLALKALPTKAHSKVFDPLYITTNSTSRLGKADMYHMLTDNDTAWTSLSSEQQAALVSMLPNTAETQRLLARIRTGETEDTRPQYLKASNIFRAEVAKFQTDLTNGHLAKTWQAAAEQAVTERATGEYDAWKAQEAELWWGQKSK